MDRARQVDRARLEAEIRNFFERDPEGARAIAVYLFGSRARGTEHAGSDVDVAVLLGRGPARCFDDLPLGLESRLERRLGLPIQLVALDDASPDFVHHVLRHGRLVLDRDPSKRIRFEVAKRNEYFDLLPILEEYRRARPRRP